MVARFSREASSFLLRAQNLQHRNPNYLLIGTHPQYNQDIILLTSMYRELPAVLTIVNVIVAHSPWSCRVIFFH